LPRNSPLAFVNNGRNTGQDVSDVSDKDYEDDVNLLEPFFGFPFPSFCHAQLFVELVDVNYTRC
jgi:hypothetical protein